MDSTGCLNDQSLGPTVEGCRGDFDFTLKFQRIFLAIIPGSVFISLCLARIVHLYQLSRVVDGLLFQSAKLAILTIYTTLQFSLLIILTAANNGSEKGLSIAASSVSFVSGFFMLLLSYGEHSRCPRPSILLNVYVFLTLLFDIVHTRTSWLIADDDLQNSLYARLFTACLGAKVVILLLESQHKTRWLRWDSKEHSPEEVNGLFGLGVFSWINSLLIRGYRSVLTVDDLYPLDAGMVTETLFPRLERQLQSPGYRSHKHSLAIAVIKALAVPWLLPVAPHVAAIGFKFAQPFFIETLLKYLQASALPDGPSPNIGYGLIGAAAFIYVGIAVSQAFASYYSWRSLYMVRGVLAAAVYKKTTEAKSSAGRNGAALTLMSTDIERVMRGLFAIHQIWVSFIEIALGTWLLQRQLGAAFAAPIITIIVVGLIAGLLSRYTGRRQRAWMAVIQKRVELTASTIAAMKGLKITGMVNHVADTVRGIRKADIEAGNRWRFIIIASAVIAHVPQAISPVLAFAVTSRNLDTTTIYTSMTYILLLASPLAMLFMIMPTTISGFVCLTRIQTFLEAEPRVDYRKVSGPRAIDTISEKSHVPMETERPKISIKITKGSFGWTSDKMSLTEIDATITTGKLTMVVGPVASGKSTFCLALLGEVPFASGEVVMHAAQTEKIGFCEQNPFLLNATLKENVIGFAPFDQAKYDEIIEATRLELDVSLMPSGHDTRIGSNGIMLSGGQKQRVSLARALYLESDLVIFDDILSGLDSDTETEVFRRVFGSDGILRRRRSTVVLCTHSVRHLPVADHIIALGSDGTVVEAGSFKELMQNNKYVRSLGVKASDAATEERLSDAGPDHKRGLSAPGSPGRAKLDRKPKVLAHKLDKARQVGDRTVYWHYLGFVGKPLLCFLCLLGILYGFDENFSNVWMGFWTEDRFSRDSAFYIGIFALLRTTHLVWLFSNGVIIMVTVVTLTGTSLHNNALKTVVTAPLSFLTNTDTGMVTNLFSQDITLIDGMATVIAVATPHLAAGYPVLLGILYVIQKFYLRTSRQMRFLDLEAKSPLYTHFIDTIKGVATIRAFNWVASNLARNNNLLDTSQRPAYLLLMIQEWLALVLQLMVAGLAVVLVALATQMSAAASATGASLVTLLSFGTFLSQLILVYTTLETSIGAVARLKTFSEVVKPEDLPGEDVKPDEDWPSRGKIEIKNLSASYDSDDSPQLAGSEEKNAPEQTTMALRDLSLSIRPGEKVAVCGRTGSGKSSLFLVLVRLLDPFYKSHEGITIDDVKLNFVDRATLRERIIAVPQDAVFLPGSNSIRANLDPLSAASDEECLEVLRTVKLERFVRGGDGIVGSRGRNTSSSSSISDDEEAVAETTTTTTGLSVEMHADSLSAGQKQLFSLGRAILRRRIRDGKRGEGMARGGVLLLDEVSSSVDHETDRAMQEVIKREFADYTIVMVSHRLDMVVDFFDTVVLLDKGSLVETGSPKELMKQDGSRFGELVRSARN